MVQEGILLDDTGGEARADVLAGQAADGAVLGHALIRQAAVVTNADIWVASCVHS